MRIIRPSGVLKSDNAWFGAPGRRGGACSTNVENLRRALGDGTEIEVVVHGKALGLVTADSPERRRLDGLAYRGGFAACENTMRRASVTSAELLPYAVTVDSGVAAVVPKQKRWSYVKSG